MFSNAGSAPYRLALGEEAASLHPQLKAYVDAVPTGCHGLGRGVFTSAGLRRSWLRPVFALLARWGIAFPERGVDVPFDVRNTSGDDGAVHAVRTFHFADISRTMVDETRIEGGVLIDRLGRRGFLEVALAARVDRGGMVLESTAIAVRVGRARVPVPHAVRVVLEERAVEGDGRRQRVDVRVSVSGLGVVYGYRGEFTYEVRCDAAADTVVDMEEPKDAADRETPGTAQVVRFCRHRSQGRRCTRPLGHAGLHRHRTILWGDAGSDPPRCAGSGEPGEPAAALPDGYPDGRALCQKCQRFVTLDEHGRLVPHDASDEGESDAEVSRRREWLNAHGW